MLSPSFRVREFEVHDVSPYSIELAWGPAPSKATDPSALMDLEMEKSTSLFTPFNPIPSVKMISFADRTHPFQLVARYSDLKDMSPSTNPIIGRYYISGMTAPKNQPVPKIKVRIKLNINGMISVTSAQLIEDVKEEPPATMNTNTNANAAPSQQGNGNATPEDKPKPASEQPKADMEEEDKEDMDTSAENEKKDSKKDDKKESEPKKEDKKDDDKKDDKKDDTKKDEAKKDETKKDETKKDEAQEAAKKRNVLRELISRSFHSLRVLIKKCYSPSLRRKPRWLIKIV